MRRPRLLDLFCGAGGATMGYYRAGFDVVGVDIKPQPRYPFEFRHGDALEARLEGFDVIHASPPCQRWTRSSRADEHADLLTPIRERLMDSGAIWVIENVPAAPLRDPVVLCGSSFGLRVRRHRGFESSAPVFAAACSHESQPDFVTVAGGGPNPASFNRGPNATGGPDRKPRNVADAQDAMGIDWMTRAELNEAIPPAYTGVPRRSAPSARDGGRMSASTPFQRLDEEGVQE